MNRTPVWMVAVCADASILDNQQWQVSPLVELAFMQQRQPQVAAFLRACWQRRWQTPPDDVVFAECLPPPQDAQAVSEEVGQFYSACSEFYESFDACSDF